MADGPIYTNIEWEEDGADPTEKMEALMASVPPTLRPGRFRKPDELIALLQSAENARSYAKS